MTGDKMVADKDNVRAQRAGRETMTAYELLLFEYASGVLDEACSLAVASHLTLSDMARRQVAAYEALGGALLEGLCAPVEMNPGSLKAVVGLLDCPQAKSRCVPEDEMIAAPADLELPQPLARYICRHQKAATGVVRWRRFLPGIHVMKLTPRSSRQQVRIYKVAPGVRAPYHSHGDQEIVLILEGSLYDGGEVYRCGDLVVNARKSSHAPRAGEDGGCLCLSVGGWYTGVQGLLERLLNF